MIGDIIVIACLIAPFALMWWLLRVQRRVRALPRKDEAEPRFGAPFTDEVRSADGLVYAKAFDVNDELLEATRRVAEPSDVKNLQGIR
jgi:hypothetical protein